MKKTASKPLSMQSIVLLAFAVGIVFVTVFTWSSVRELGQLVERSDMAQEHTGHSPQWEQSDSKQSSPGVAPDWFSPLSTKSGMCYVMTQTDFPGEGLVPGNLNILPTAGACCESCLNYKPKSPAHHACTNWVWCGDKAKCGRSHKFCWLKFNAWPEGILPLTGPEIGWTSGSVKEPPVKKERSLDGLKYGNGDRAYHVLTTAQGSATHWEMRVHYYWYKKQQKECRRLHGENCHMGGFTRLLHSGVADELTVEIPTYVVKELPAGHHNGYIVLNRPYGMLQWINEVEIKEKYIFMSEPDHIFLRPLPNLMIGDRPAAFPFFYIEPSKTEFAPLTRKFIGQEATQAELESIPPIGSSPTFLATSDLKWVIPRWVNMSISIFEDVEAHKAWNWVMEMYAFTIALHVSKVAPVDLHLRLAAQPPWDKKLTLRHEHYFILHYTYSDDYTLDGVFTPGKKGAWQFNKRDFAQMPPPHPILSPIPPNLKNDLVRTLIASIDEATAAIPGWDHYHETGRATQFMKYD